LKEIQPVIYGWWFEKYELWSTGEKLKWRAKSAAGILITKPIFLLGKKMETCKQWPVCLVLEHPMFIA
jgi:hypothetical protein